MRVARNASAAAAIIFAMTAAGSGSAAGADPPRGAPPMRTEIQIALCSPPERIERALDLRARGAPIKVWLFDDASLTLFGRGLRFRLRVADGRSELTLKVADQDCARLDPKVVPPGEGKCEYDVHGTRMAGAVSLTRSLGASSADELLAGRVTLAQVLSASQIAYLRDVVGMWPLPPGIRALGPLEVRTYRTRGKPYDVDISRLPAGEEYVEISRKVPMADADRATGHPGSGPLASRHRHVRRPVRAGRQQASLAVAVASRGRPRAGSPRIRVRKSARHPGAESSCRALRPAGIVTKLLT